MNKFEEYLKLMLFKYEKLSDTEFEIDSKIYKLLPDDSFTIDEDGEVFIDHEENDRELVVFYFGKRWYYYDYKNEDLI